MDELGHLVQVARVVRVRSLALEGWIWAGERAAVEMDGGKQARVQEVQGPHALVVALLHDEPLKELRPATQEQEIPTDGVPKRIDATPLLKEIPERVEIHAIARLGKKAGIGCLRRRGGGERGAC